MDLTPSQVLEIAAKAKVDPRTVRNVFAGSRGKPMVRERVLEAAKQLGINLPNVGEEGTR